ncbi:MAG: hypothetical protein J6R80_06035 [Kiritimatiellae bacterium]|nr:hypothetical protein [Kiritimatiellia bacterium]
MNIEKFNTRFGAHGRIVFKPGFAGYPNVVLAGRYGVAEVSLLGANVLSYRPTGQSPVIFRPAKKDDEYNRGDSFHGGIPVCWPQFGNRFSKSLPQHGFASKLVFEPRASEYSDEMTSITLGLRSNEETLAIWPHKFDLELEISVTMKLNLTLRTKNIDDSPFDFSCGFHPYFILRNRDEALVRGVDGFECLLAARENDLGERSGDIKLDYAPDDVFALPDTPKHAFAILDPGLRRAIAVVSAGNTREVVWNCGEGANIVDFGEGDWQRYVCVEPVSDWPGGRTLEPGQSHELMVAIQSSIDESASSGN